MLLRQFLTYREDLERDRALKRHVRITFLELM